ncbi:MAG: anaerobic ribonucleoside-triphosphate reductase [Planctomycetota bacterium]
METLENDCGLGAEQAEQIARDIEASISAPETLRITTGEIRSIVAGILRSGEYSGAAKSLGVYGPALPGLDLLFRTHAHSGKPYLLENALVSDVFRSYSLGSLHSSEVSQAHLDGVLYIEGLDYPARYIAGCYAIDSIKKYGIGHAAPARDAREFIAHIAAFLNYVGTRYVDSVCLAFLNPLFAPVVAGMEYSEMRREAEAFLFAVSRVELARRGSVVLDLHTGVPNCLRDVAALGAGGVPTGKTYGDYCSASREFAWVMLDVMRDIIREGKTSVPTCVLHVSSASFANPAENDLLRFACSTAAEAGVPDFHFDRAMIKFVPCGEVKDSSAPDLERLRATVAGSVSLNLPQAAYRAAGNVEDFWFELDSATELAARAEIERVNFLRTAAPNGANSVSPEYVIGITGLNECIERLTGQELHESEDAHAAALRVLAFLEIKCRDMGDKFGMRFILREGSSEAAERFAKIDHARFPEASKHIRGNEETDAYFYTRGANLRADAPVEILKRVLLESAFHRVISGRTEIALDGDDTDVSAESIMKVVERTYYRTDSAHLALRGDVSVCKVCGGFRVAAEECIRCGAKDSNAGAPQEKKADSRKVKIVQPYLFPELRD